MRSILRTVGFINNHPLAKKYVFRSYYNFITWQLKSMLNSGFHEVPFIANTKFLAKKGMTGVTGNIYTGLHEFEDMSFLLHLLREEDIFLDVGANVGSYTLLASGVTKARSIAFEPIPDTFDTLTKNIALNNLQHVAIAENKGVGSKSDENFFTKNQDTTNHVLSVDEVDDEAISVPIAALDNYYPQIKPILIKIDVEGFETEVLNGATHMLHDHSLKAIIIELNGSGSRYGYSEQAIHEKLLNLNFIPCHYEPFSRRLVSQNDFGEFNTIYVRDEAFIIDRLTTATPFRVFNSLI